MTVPPWILYVPLVLFSFPNTPPAFCPPERVVFKVILERSRVPVFVVFVVQLPTNPPALPLLEVTLDTPSPETVSVLFPFMHPTKPPASPLAVETEIGPASLINFAVKFASDSMVLQNKPL